MLKATILTLICIARKMGTFGTDTVQLKFYSDCVDFHSEPKAQMCRAIRRFVYERSERNDHSEVGIGSYPMSCLCIERVYN